MYARTDLQSAPLGRRIIERMSGGRFRLSPAIVPEIVAWLRIHGNRYVALLTACQASTRVSGDSFVQAMKQTTSFRINLIQDLINMTMDTFGIRDYNESWSDTCTELGITDMDTDPELFDDTPIHDEGSGI